MKNSKTHYVTLRIVFDKPCDQATAIKGARYGLTRDKEIPARNFAAAHFGGEPTTFRVDRVMRK